MGSEGTVTGTSLTSFQEAAESAWSEVPGDQDREGARAANVSRAWITGGGIVGTEYHVELTVLSHEDST
jgi:hypothetical protein